MNDDIKIYIKNTIVELIKNTSNEKAIKKSIKKHNEKIHFIPIRYRIFNGLLQSMNIKFGNFIERLLHIIIENEDNLEVLECSGKNNIKLPITQESDNLVDNYITECQNGCFSDMELKANFEKLLNKCITVEKNTKNKEIEIKHDIDVLFKNKLDNKIYYLEVKYNDDHDTGKFVDINRKLIKSYIGICNILQIYDINEFKPILYYMTQKRLKGNIYLPEYEYIYRGDKLFSEFFSINYSDLDKFMKNIGDNKEIIVLFDELYNKIRNKLEIK
jgi:hypothetical protein